MANPSQQIINCANEGTVRIVTISYCMTLCCHRVSICPSQVLALLKWPNVG